MDFSWRSAQQKLQVLRIQPDEARRFQQVASHLLFPNDSCVRLTGFTGKQKRAIGPLAVRYIRRSAVGSDYHWRSTGNHAGTPDASGPHLLADAGVVADLLIVNEEAAGYELPLQERLQQMIQAHTLSRGR